MREGCISPEIRAECCICNELSPFALAQQLPPPRLSSSLAHWLLQAQATG